MGHEKTLTGLTVALAGASLVYGAGMLDSGITFDCAQLAMDNEWAKLIKMVVAGIRVDDEMLMVDDIAKIGSFGDFLSLESTYKHMRSQSQPQLMDRRVREEWITDGATDMYARARLEAQEVLTNHAVEPIDADIQKQMRALVDAADAEKGVG